MVHCFTLVYTCAQYVIYNLWFQDANHAHSDEELLRKKVQSITECFLDSVTSPTLQVRQEDILGIALKHASFWKSEITIIIKIVNVFWIRCYVQEFIEWQS